MKTKILNNGLRVLAKDYKGELVAVGYANMTQSQKRAMQLRSEGWNVWTRCSRPFYVIFGDPDRLEQVKPVPHCKQCQTELEVVPPPYDTVDYVLSCPNIDCPNFGTEVESK